MLSDSPDTATANRLPKGLRQRLAELFPQAAVGRVQALGPDADPSDEESTKCIGYGRPLRIELAFPDGSERTVVFHTATANDFGHDRRSDRAAAMLLAYDTFHLIPEHVRALDVGAIADDGSLRSLAGTSECYLVTEWAQGSLYAEDLRRVARQGCVQSVDLARAEALARYLVGLHRLPGTHAGAYVRALRDLIGHGEGIAGIADGYSASTPGASRARLQEIERAALEWRFRLRDQTSRLRRTHGDFHPFNLVFDGQTSLFCLDTSRGSEGEPADDVACLSINYLFFGLEHRERWSAGLGQLWDCFFRTYLAESNDPGLLAALAPFYAWRALVIASPLWYPHMHAEDRDRILRFAERVLRAERFDPAWGREAMA